MSILVKLLIKYPINFGIRIGKGCYHPRFDTKKLQRFVKLNDLSVCKSHSSQNRLTVGLWFATVNDSKLPFVKSRLYFSMRLSLWRLLMMKQKWTVKIKIDEGRDWGRSWLMKLWLKKTMLDEDHEWRRPWLDWWRPWLMKIMIDEDYDRWRSWLMSIVIDEKIQEDRDS